MTLEEKIELIARDYDLEILLEQNDITYEMLITELVSWGWIDLDEYFYKDISLEDSEEYE